MQKASAVPGAPAPAAGRGLRAELLRGGVVNAVLQATGAVLSLGVAVLLARALGAQGYGTYAYVFALISLLVVPAQFGLPTLVLRETARAEAGGHWGRMRGLWRWAGWTAGGFAVALAAAGAVAARALQHKFDPSQVATFGWALLLVPLLVLGALRGAALRGLRRPVQGHLPDQVVRPALFLLALAGASLVSPRLAPEHAMALNALAAAAAFALGAWLLCKARPAPLLSHPEPEYEIRAWFASVLPLAFLSALALVMTHIDVVMLGLFGVAAQDIGAYRVAMQCAVFISFGLNAILGVALPYFARFHAQHDMVRFQRLATAIARASFAFALLAALAAWLLGERLLGAVFGAEFTQGYPVLLVLVVAQLVHVGLGTVGPLLNMTGYERDTAKAVAIAAAGNIALNAVLIPLYGAIGAACATGLAMAAWKVILWSLVRRRLGVDSSVLGLFGRRPDTLTSRFGINETP